jgi:DNA (cytosine-5)-methyltransferase 1
MKYLSVASGIEAVTTAWHPLGFEPVAFSEIDAFPSAALQHHYPEVPNAGDFTTIEGGEYGSFDVLVGGTPCQSFSVAGKRGGMEDARGNLALEFIRLAYRSHPQWVLWENVPGVLSSAKGADFGCFLSELSGVDLPAPAKGWKNSGLVIGLDGCYSLAWRVLDAQYFGVPQRRRRLFVVGHLGDWRRAASVLLEPESLLGNPPPSRETRKGSAGDPAQGPAPGSRNPSHWDGDFPHPTLSMSFNTGTPGYSNQEIFSQRGAYLVPADEPAVGCWWDGGQVSQTLDAVLSKGQCMPEKNRFPAVLVPDVSATLKGNRGAGGGGIGPEETLLPVAFAQNSRDEVRLFGGDGQTVGALAAEPGMKQTTYVAFCNEVAPTIRSGGNSTGGDRPPGTDIDTVDSLIAFSCKDHGADAGTLSPTLRSMGHDGSHANAGGQVAVAFCTEQTPKASADLAFTVTKGSPTGGGHPQAVAYAVRTAQTSANGIGVAEDTSHTLDGANGQAVCFESRFVRNGRGSLSDLVPPLKAESGVGDSAPLVTSPTMAVRRLTPRECERLQGFPDDFTLVPYRKKPSADGPRYKAIGNSMAVPVMAWIGERMERFSAPDVTALPEVTIQ